VALVGVDNFVVIICQSMLILALDTTTRAGSCALARDGRVLREEASDAERGHAERLPGDLAALLEHAGVELREVDAFAVATGPGSFTGLRIGIATMQGLAVAMGKPLIGVSAFEALATIANGTIVATWIDAWRGEVYAALYEGGQEITPPTVALPETLLARLRDASARQADPVLFIGDGAATFRELIGGTLGGRARFADPVTPAIAGTIALLATNAARAGDAPPPHAIRPLYVRRPDPELAAARRKGAPYGTPIP
jgi:tRNA threonylcarbamoyladenosine biosynthesis protein TsaB